MPKRFRIGAVGWDHPDWVGTFYPAGTRPTEMLRRYADRFPIVEAASSYYGMPRRETVETWAKTTPDDFRITLKLPDRMVRQDPHGDDLPRALQAFTKRAQLLGPKLSGIVAQFHPSFRSPRQDANLTAFLAALPEGPRWAVELRDESWWHDATYATLASADVTLVWSTWTGGRTPPIETTDRLYVRLIGDRELPGPFDMKRRDRGDEMDAIVRELQGARSAHIDVVVSDHYEGHAPATVRDLRERLGLARRPHREGLQQTRLM